MLPGSIAALPVGCRDTGRHRLALRGVSESGRHPHPIGNGNFRLGQALRAQSMHDIAYFRRSYVTMVKREPRRHLSMFCFNCHSSIRREAKYKRTKIAMLPVQTPVHWNEVQGSAPAASAAVARDNINSSAAAMRSQRSQHGRRTFTPAHCKSQDIGWPLSLETAAAKSQSRVDAGFTHRSLWCAAFATVQSLSYSVSRGTSTMGDSGSAPYSHANAQRRGDNAGWPNRETPQILGCDAAPVLNPRPAAQTKNCSSGILVGLLASTMGSCGSGTK